MNLQREKQWKKIILLVFIFLLYIAGNLLSICLYSLKDELQEADVAIILGAATYYDEVSPVYRERLNHGITLYQQGYIKKIIVTGGNGAGNEYSDAYIAKQYVISQGVPEENVLMEEQSKITQENLENTKAIMDENGYEDAIIVSDPLHMKRSMLIADDIGIAAYSSPTPTSMYRSLKTKIPFAFRELFFYVGYKWYRIFY